MAKKKKKKKRRIKVQTKTKDRPPRIDPRAVEKTTWDLGRILKEHEFESIDEANTFMQGLTRTGSIPSPTPKTPLEEATALMYDAWDARGRERITLARKALEVSEDCADAYVLLAEETATSLEEARALYEKGVRAGERALGPETFEEDAGDFWGFLETRPYMRARAGLASVLWLLGERAEAMNHYAEMLRLNPNDNQGIREVLINCYFEAADDVSARKLIDLYKDNASICWAYSRTLLAYREHGAGREAQKSLDDAIAVNRHVPSFLTGKKKPPRHPPETFRFGDENEAILYVVDAITAWDTSKGAIEWLRKTTQGGKH